MADGTTKCLRDIKWGDMVDAGPLGAAEVLGKHYNTTHGRLMYELCGIPVTADHLFVLEDGSWGAIDPWLYAKLRDSVIWKVHGPDDNDPFIYIPFGMVPTAQIKRIKVGTRLYGGLKVDSLRCVYVPPETALRSIYTDKGAYMIENGLITDSFPMNPSPQAFPVSRWEMVQNRFRRLAGKFDVAPEDRVRGKIVLQP